VRANELGGLRDPHAATHEAHLDLLAAMVAAHEAASSGEAHVASGST